MSVSSLFERATDLTSRYDTRFKLSDDLDDTPLVTHARHRRHLEVRRLSRGRAGVLADSISGQECVGFMEAFLSAFH